MGETVCFVNQIAQAVKKPRLVASRPGILAGQLHVALPVFVDLCFPVRIGWVLDVEYR